MGVVVTSDIDVDDAVDVEQIKIYGRSVAGVFQSESIVMNGVKPDDDVAGCSKPYAHAKEGVRYAITCDDDVITRKNM